MLSIIIDGYNLIGTAHKNLDAARRDLIEKLLRYSRAKGHHVTVVFDGWKDGQLKETRTRTENVTVIYSRLGEKADDVIKRLLQTTQSPIAVVSSDSEIAEFARKRNIVAFNSEEFEQKLYDLLSLDENMILEKSSWVRNDHPSVSSCPRKGRGRKLSSEEKKKMQVLKKL